MQYDDESTLLNVAMLKWFATQAGISTNGKTVSQTYTEIVLRINRFAKSPKDLRHVGVITDLYSKFIPSDKQRLVSSFETPSITHLRGSLVGRVLKTGIWLAYMAMYYTVVGAYRGTTGVARGVGRGVAGAGRGVYRGASGAKYYAGRAFARKKVGSPTKKTGSPAKKTGSPAKKTGSSAKKTSAKKTGAPTRKTAATSRFSRNRMAKK